MDLLKIYGTVACTDLTGYKKIKTIHCYPEKTWQLKAKIIWRRQRHKSPPVFSDGYSKQTGYCFPLLDIPGWKEK